MEGPIYMKKRIVRLLFAVITTLSFITPFLGKIGVNKVYGKEEHSTIYHRHTGSSIAGGGCYSKIVYCNGNINSKTESITCGCTGSVISQTQWKCTAGHIENNSVGGGWYECPHSIGCGTVVGSRTYYQCATCNAIYSTNPGKCTANKGFVLQCNKDETDPLATITCVTDTDDWTTKVILSAQVSIIDPDFTLGSNPYIWNGKASAENTYLVTENGNYTLELLSNENASPEKISISISNIDSIAPSIQLLTISPQGSTSDLVTVKVDATDTGGSGLAEKAYSYNGGSSWVNSCENSFSENGNYNVIVRDKAGNQTSREFTISYIVKKVNTENSSGAGSNTGTSSISISSPTAPSPTSSANALKDTTSSANTVQGITSSEQSNSSDTKKSSNSKSNTKPQNTNLDNPKTNAKSNNSITKTPDASVRGNSIKFVPYQGIKNEDRSVEESVSIKEEELLAKNDPQSLNTLSNNMEYSAEEQSLWSSLFSMDMIKNILIVFMGTLLSVFTILYIKKKISTYYMNLKH